MTDGGPEAVPTSEQRKALELYARYRHATPSGRELNRPRGIGDWVRRSVLGFLAFILALTGHPVLGALVGGLWLGMLTSMGAYNTRFARIWPALRDSLDWSRVEAKLASAVPTVPEKISTAGSAFLGLFLIGALAVAVDVGVNRVFNPVHGNSSNGVILLSTQWCGYCARLRKHLDDNQVPFTELDTERSWQGGMTFLSVGARGVPVLVVGDRLFYGLQAGPIDEALGAAGYRINSPLQAAGRQP